MQDKYLSLHPEYASQGQSYTDR